MLRAQHPLTIRQQLSQRCRSTRHIPRLPTPAGKITTCLQRARMIGPEVFSARTDQVLEVMYCGRDLASLAEAEASSKEQRVSASGLVQGAFGITDELFSAGA